MPIKNGIQVVKEVKEFLLKNWWPWLGRPRVLRFDQEGSLVSKELTDWLSLQGAMVEFVPRDAHWQLSLPERVIAVLKGTLSAMARTSPGTSPE